MVRDYDISCSFSRAFLDRHPWAGAVGKWILGDLLSELPGMTREVAKDFVNRCFGLGKQGIAAWCKEHGYERAPEPLLRYHGEIQKGMDIDLERHAEMARKVQEETGKQNWSLKVAVAYILNSEFESKTLKAAEARMAGLAELRCNELDGMFIQRQPFATWQQIEKKLGHVFKYKPYRPRGELLNLLLAETPCGPQALRPSCKDWKKQAEVTHECAQRLRLGEKPVVLLGSILQDSRLGRVLLSDKYKTSPCAGKTLSCYHCSTRANGYIWEQTVGDHDVRLECDLVSVLCSTCGIASTSRAPRAWVIGSLTRSLCSRLAQPLYDSSFLVRTDGDHCNGKVAFADGTVYDMQDALVRASTPQDCVRRHLSYAYPHEAFQRI